MSPEDLLSAKKSPISPSENRYATFKIVDFKPSSDGKGILPSKTAHGVTAHYN